MTKRQLWAKKRNWMLFRLRGMGTVFTGYNREFVSSLVPEKDLYLIDQLNNNIIKLIKIISDSKYVKGEALAGFMHTHVENIRKEN